MSKKKPVDEIKTTIETDTPEGPEIKESGIEEKKTDDLSQIKASEVEPDIGENPFKVVHCGSGGKILAQEIAGKGVVEVINGIPVYIPGARLQTVRAGVIVV